MKAQLPNGGWQSYATQADGILNTAASLLALLCHQEHPDYAESPIQPANLESSISKAETWLGPLLQEWDVENCDQVGFEISVPSLLDLLAAKEIHFKFPARTKLVLLNQRKLSRFSPDRLYSTKQSTLVHPLEALVGRLDFDKVGHHLIQGSMMLSPLATAAYLMYSSVWDDEAEKYLRKVLESGCGEGSGGFPSTFPTPIFEAAWVREPL